MLGKIKKLKPNPIKKNWTKPTPIYYSECILQSKLDGLSNVHTYHTIVPEIVIVFLLYNFSLKSRAGTGLFFSDMGQVEPMFSGLRPI